MSSIEGKTKIITPLKNYSGIGVVEAKDYITAGDGAKRGMMPGKAELATRTTCNVFDFLGRRDIPLAYIGRDSPTTFLTQICRMIPVEVVVRFVATGSYIKRNPKVKEGTIFEEPVVEFFYKTNGQKFGGENIGCDDPLMALDKVNGFYLFHPQRPTDKESHVAHSSVVYNEKQLRQLFFHLGECDVIALITSSELRNVWQKFGGRLHDLKFEFGVLNSGQIVLADVVDCDSWRVVWNGIQLSKQPYRDGADVSETLEIYRLAASLTDKFLNL